MRRRKEQIARLDKALRASGVCDCASPRVFLCKKEIDAYERGEIKLEPCGAGCPPEKKLVVCITFACAGRCWCAGCANGKNLAEEYPPEACQCGTCGYCKPFATTPARLPEPDSRPAQVTENAQGEAGEALPGTIEGRARDRTVTLVKTYRPRRLEDVPLADQPDCAACGHPSRLHSQQSDHRHCLTMLVFSPTEMSNGPCSCAGYQA